jgi:hypothetical protein
MSERPFLADHRPTQRASPKIAALKLSRTVIVHVISTPLIYRNGRQVREAHRSF